MVTQRHNTASRILLKGITKGPLGAGLSSMDIGSAHRLTFQDLQIPEHSTNRTLNASSLIVSQTKKGSLLVALMQYQLFLMKGVPRNNFRYPLKSRGGYKGNREHSAPATATPPASKARHPSQLLSKQRHIHLVEIKYCGDTRPKNQLTPGPRISWRPPSSSTATYVAIF
eukprot:1158916-Pelagomonas_calceolata.AAC.22